MNLSKFMQVGNDVTLATLSSVKRLSVPRLSSSPHTPQAV